MTTRKKDDHENADAGSNAPDAANKPQRDATATPPTVTAPPGKGTGTGAAPSAQVEKLRNLAAALDRGDTASARPVLRQLFNEAFDQMDASAPPLTRGLDDADRQQALKAHAARIEELCQHAEGGTNHPVSRAALAGGASWLQTLLPILTQLLADLLARQGQGRPQQP